MTIPPKYEDVVAQLDAALGHEADLREELATLRESYESMRDRKNSIVELQQRLTVAEQRISELESLLSEVVGLDPRGEFLGWQLDGKIDAALKPAVEPEHICEGCGSKGWTANCAQCVPY